jgi:hypothetical protein
MLLRRVINHVRKQEWTAIGIDFLIVVLGVFVATQVANWNNDRAARSAERGTLIRLYEDFAESRVGQARDIAFLEQQLADQALILRSLDACAVEPEDDLVFQRGISELGYINPPRIYRRTIDELASAGRTDLIRNSEISEELASIVALLEWRSWGFEQVVMSAQHFRYILEERVRHDVTRIVPDEFIPAHAGGVDYDIATLCADPAVAAAVSAISYTTKERLEAYKPIMDRYSAFMLLLEAELQSRWGVDARTLEAAP